MKSIVTARGAIGRTSRNAGADTVTVVRRRSSHRTGASSRGHDHGCIAFALPRRPQLGLGLCEELTGGWIATLVPVGPDDLAVSIPHTG